MNVKICGAHYFIKTTGIIVYSRSKELLFEGLMLAMIEYGVRQDATRTVTVEIEYKGNSLVGAFNG